MELTEGKAKESPELTLTYRQNSRNPTNFRTELKRSKERVKKGSTWALRTAVQETWIILSKENLIE